MGVITYAIIGGIVGVVAICCLCFLIFGYRKNKDHKTIVVMASQPGRNDRNRIVSFRVSEALYSTYDKQNASSLYMANPYHQGSQDFAIEQASSPDLDDPYLEQTRTEPNIGARIMEFGNAVRRSSIFQYGIRSNNGITDSSAFDLSASISPTTSIAAERNLDDPMREEGVPRSQYDRTGVIDDFTRPSAWTKPEEASSNQDKKKKKSKCTIS
jgi:hypothetical protein